MCGQKCVLSNTNRLLCYLRFESYAIGIILPLLNYGGLINVRRRHVRCHKNKYCYLPSIITFTMFCLIDSQSAEALCDQCAYIKDQVS